MTLENALSLALLLAPHIAHIEEHWGELQTALESTDGKRPQLLTATFSALREEMVAMPGDMVKAMGLLVDMEPSELAGRITAQEFVAALPALDKVNDLAGLWAAIRALGLTARYRNGQSRTD